jgi:RNA polymerase sigma factor (sigma-70 family)
VLTIDTIRAAQDNDLAATTAVIEWTESRVQRHAEIAARRIAPHGGAAFANYREEFVQIARIAVWDSLSRFTDGTVDSFERYAFTTIENKLKDEVRSARNSGGAVDENAMKTFAAMVEAADGDAYEAAKLCQTIPPKGRRLSADRAEAARLAWQGNVSLDKPVSTSEAGESTLADFLPTYDEQPDGEIRPKVGHGAALEALAVLRRYTGVEVQRMTPGGFTGNLPALVETLEDTVRVPADPTERRYVLDAMAVLRSAVSTATEGALIEELRDVRDERMADSREKHERVNDTLDSMGQAQRDVLRHSFGINGATDFGWGDGCDMDGLCAALGMTYVNAKAHRAKGRKAFAKRYAAAVALTGATAYAAELEAAAASTLTNKGRK